MEMPPTLSTRNFRKSINSPPRTMKSNRGSIVAAYGGSLPRINRTTGPKKRAKGESFRDANEVVSSRTGVANAAGDEKRLPLINHQMAADDSSTGAASPPVSGRNLTTPAPPLTTTENAHAASPAEAAGCNCEAAELAPHTPPQASTHNSRPPSSRPLPKTLSVDDLSNPSLPSPRSFVPSELERQISHHLKHAEPSITARDGDRFTDVGSESSPPLPRQGREGGKWAHPPSRTAVVGRGKNGAVESKPWNRPPRPLGGGQTEVRAQLIGTAPIGLGRGVAGRIGRGSRTAHGVSSMSVGPLRVGALNRPVKPPPTHLDQGNKRTPQRPPLQRNDQNPQSARIHQSPATRVPVHNSPQSNSKNSSPSPARRPHEIRSSRNVDPKYQNHPLAIELKDLHQQIERSLLKLRAERTQLMRTKTLLGEEVKKEENLQHALDQLKAKKLDILASQQKLKNVDSVPNLKALLSTKSEELFVINAEYKRISAPLRARERGGTNGTAASRSGAKGKLMLALDQTRLQDELTKISKLQAIRDTVQGEVDKLEALLRDYSQRGMEALREYLSPAESGESVSKPAAIKEEIPLVPSKMPSVFKKQQELAELKAKIDKETTLHMIGLSKKLNDARKAADDAEQALLSATYVQTEQEKERTQLATDQRTLRTTIDDHKANITTLTNDILSMDMSIEKLSKQLAGVTEELQSNVARRASLEKEVRAKEAIAKEAIAKIQKEENDIKTQIAADKKNLQTLTNDVKKLEQEINEMKDKKQRRLEQEKSVSSKLQVEISELEVQITVEKAGLAEDERKHKQRLDDAAFSSQKDSILKELESSLKTWKRKTSEMDKNNAELDSRLDRILGVLRSNNIEVPF